MFISKIRQPVVFVQPLPYISGHLLGSLCGLIFQKRTYRVVDVESVAVIENKIINLGQTLFCLVRSRDVFDDIDVVVLMFEELQKEIFPEISLDRVQRGIVDQGR